MTAAARPFWEKGNTATFEKGKAKLKGESGEWRARDYYYYENKQTGWRARERKVKRVSQVR
jgi:hypothetical protein